MRRAEEILEEVLARREREQTNVLRDEAKAAIEQAQREAIEEAASIAEAIDSKRGNEAEIAKAIRRLVP